MHSEEEIRKTHEASKYTTVNHKEKQKLPKTTQKNKYVF